MHAHHKLPYRHPIPLPYGACMQEVVGLWEARIQGVLPDGECELLYGRAGYLYSLTWLQQQLGRDCLPPQLVKVGPTVCVHAVRWPGRAPGLQWPALAATGFSFSLMRAWQRPLLLCSKNACAAPCSRQAF